MRKIFSILAAVMLSCLWVTARADAQALPYSYGFEDYPQVGWTMSNPSGNNASKFVQNGASKRSGSYGIQFNSYDKSGENTQYLISPELSAPNGVNVSFYYKNSKSGYAELFKVGYSTTDTEVGSFTFGDEISESSATWKQYEGSFPAGTKYVAVYYYSNYQYYLYVDDFEFTAPAAGPALAVADGTTAIATGYSYSFGLATSGTTKTFTLSNPGTESIIVNIAATGGFDVSPANATIAAKGEETLTITMPSTSATGAVTITPTADGMDAFVINVSGTIKDPSKLFETLLDGSAPEGWTTSGGTWSWSTSNGASSSAWYESSNYRLITPKVTVSDGEVFIFDVQGTYSGYQGAKLEYSSDGETWTASETALEVTSDWQTFEVKDIPAGNYYIAVHGWRVNVRNFYGGVLPAAPKNLKAVATPDGATISWTAFGSEEAWQLSYSTTSGAPADGTLVSTTETSKLLSGLNAGTKYYVSVRIDNGDGTYGVWSDEINFTPICPAPTGLAISAITSSGATASWTAADGITTYQYVCVEKDADVDWNAAESTTAVSVELTSLDPSTAYDFYVRSYYSATSQSAAAKQSFNTKCVAASLPFEENFNSLTSAGTIPACWDNSEGTTTYANYKWSYNASGHSGACVRFDSDYNSKNNTNVLASASVSLENAAVLKFWCKNAKGGVFEVRISANGGEREDLLTGLTGITDWTEKEVDLTAYKGKTVVIYFCATSNYKDGAYIYLDDVTITEKPACATPKDVVLTDKTFNGVTVSWTAGGEETSWNLRYKTGEGDWTVKNGLTETTCALTGLTTNAAYTIQVQAACEGEWSEAAVFTPVYTVPVPAVSDVKDVTATASWAVVADASGYQYIVVAKDATPDWAAAASTTDESVELSGLEALASYDLHVAAVYGEHLEKAAAVNFTTKAIAPKNLEQVGASTTSSASFQWEADGAATKWQWSVDGESWSEPATAQTATVDGLNAGKAYVFYVRSYYSESVQSAATTLAFTTECAIATLPFAQDFGTVSGTKPTCWTIANWGTSANSWTTAGDFAKTGQALRYNARTLNSADAITSSIVISDACELKFYIKNSVGNNNAKVECKVLVNDGETTEEIADITKRYTSATEVSYDLSKFVGKTVTIIFRGVGYDTSGSPYLWIDDVTVTFKPVAAPTNLAAEPTEDGAVVTWQSEEGTSWNLQWREKDAEPEAEWTLVEGLTAKTHTLTGLSTDKTYEVQVRAIASANRKSDWTASATFQPETCPTVTGITFGFKTYQSVVVNWTASSTGKWTLRYKTGDDIVNIFTDINEQTYNLWGLTTNQTYTIEVKAMCAGDDAWVSETFTPVYTKPEVNAATDITETGANVSWSEVADAVGYRYAVAKHGEDPVWSETYNITSLTLTDLEPGTAYDFYVRTFYLESDQSDPVTIEFSTLAIAPIDLVQGEITQTTATFSWSANGMATQYQWSTDGETWSEPITALTATAEGLNAGTAYTFYVRSYYDNGAVSEPISLPFTTECGVKTLPFVEDFEAGKPVCWETDDWSETSAASKWTCDNNSYSHSGKALRFNAKTNASATITTPAILLSDKAQLSFFIRNVVGNTSTYISGKVVVADVENAENKVEAEFINSNAESLKEQVVDLEELNGKTVKVSFHATGVGTSVSGTPTLHLDDVSVTVKPSDPSAVDQVVTGKKVNKTIENDQVVIIRNGVKYNALGVTIR